MKRELYSESEITECRVLTNSWLPLLVNVKCTRWGNVSCSRKADNINRTNYLSLFSF